MTVTLSKTKLAIAVFVVALLAPATALATHIFDDVDDSKFYAEPVEWAADNGITTGKTPTSFAPDDGVTRGEAVTFLKRYNDNVVEPALEALPAGPKLYIARELDASYQNMATGVETDLGSLTVPAGTYLFNARVLLNNNSATDFLDCTLSAGTDQDDFSGGGIMIGDPDEREIATLTFAETLDTETTVTLTCTSSTDSSNAGRVVISALELGEFSETVING